MSLKEIFLKKIYEELVDFKSSFLNKSKDEIYDDAYKIDSFITLYQVLVDSVDDLQVAVMIALLKQTGGILASLYSEYCGLCSDQYSSMSNFIHNMEE